MGKKQVKENLNLRADTKKENFSTENSMVIENTILQIQENYMKENLKKIIWKVKE